MPKPTLPVSGHYLESVRDSARALTESASVQIDEDAIRRLLASPAFTDSFARVSQSHGLTFPLNFPSSLAELNFLSVLSLLNFASGYRLPLRDQTGRGAWDSIRFLVLALFLSSSSTTGAMGDPLSARGLSTLTEQRIAELMNLTLHVETPHPTIPGLTVGQLGGPIYELVKLITHTLTETGNILIQNGYQDLGSFVLEALKEAERHRPGRPNPDIVLERLVRAIPAFQDMSIVNEQPVYCFKKALFLIHAIKIRFGTTDIPSCSTDDFPIFSDNVIPSLLVYLGIIRLDQATTLGLSSLFNPSEINQPSLFKSAPPIAESAASAAPPRYEDGPVLNEDQAYVLRAAAIHACERIVTVAHATPVTASSDGGVANSPEWVRRITLPEVDLWLWAVAKDRPDYRRLGRFVLRDTVFF